MATTLAFDVIARDHASGTFNKVGNSADGLGGKMKNFAKVGAAGLAIAGAAAGKFAIDAISSASDLNETMSKSSVIFGKNAGAIQKWAGGAARTMGLSKNAALGAAAGFGDMFSQIGFSGNQAAKMSKQVVQMSADLGSFNNLETSDVADRMSAAFRGEFDSLQALVPNINATRVETEALAMTGKKSAKELTAQEKAAATLAIVQKDGARAQGDFARTSGGLANQQKILAAQFENTKAKIGTALLPVATKFVMFLNNDFGPAAQRAGDWFKEKVLPPLRDFGEKIAPKVRDVMGKIKQAFSDAQPYFQIAGQVFTNVLMPALSKAAEVVLPVLGRQIEMTGKAFGLFGKFAIGAWNNFLAPVFRFLAKGIATAASGWAVLFRALSKVPSFGWAKGAAEKLEAVARTARHAADNINNIPNTKDIKVRYGVSVEGEEALKALLLGPLGGSTPTHAAGTTFFRGGATGINEQGREVVTLPRGSKITNAASSRADSDSDERLVRALMKALERMQVVRLNNAGQGAYLATGGF
jgi:hypothetical protein